MKGVGETALVTGASSGIGRETVIRLARRGYRVIGVARRMDRISQIASHLEGVVPKRADLSKPEEVEALCNYISERTEPISVLVNNAGYSIRGALENIPLHGIRRLFEVNLFSLIRIIQACLPGMRRQRAGTIVNLSSVAGKFAFPMSGVYAATKHAVEAINDALRAEVRPFGIRVVTIRPGAIATEFNEVANRMTSALVARPEKDYEPLQESLGTAMGRIFSQLELPGPGLIADLIERAVLSESPKPVYTAGPLVKEFLEPRLSMDDEAYDKYMSEKTGLLGLKV
ncbi:MAG: short-chain dehydrogenase/reductase [Deltaproteobacteria bacterium]|nr:MAG: short-chain dehydrogenase/reductase [Deltaproteobacteria bacterium]